MSLLLPRLRSLLGNAQISSRPALSLYRCQHDAAASAESSEASEKKRLPVAQPRRVFVNKQHYENLITSFAKDGKLPNDKGVLLLNILKQRVIHKSLTWRSNTVAKVFEDTQQRDERFYNALVQNYCVNGSDVSSAEVIQQMNNDGLIPEQKVLTSLVALNCSRGDIEGAIHIINYMKQKRIYLQSEVFGHLAYGQCMVGNHDEAMKIIHDMHSAGYTIYGSVLSIVCRGLIPAKNDYHLDEMIKIFMESSKQKIDMFKFLDLARVAISTNSVHKITKFYQLTNGQSFDSEFTLKSMQGAGKYLTSTFKHFNLKIERSYVHEFLAETLNEKILADIENIDQWLAYIEDLASICSKSDRILTSEALKLVCKYRNSFCIDTLVKIKDLGLEPKPWALLQVALSSSDNYAKLTEFCSLNKIDFDASGHIEVIKHRFESAAASPSAYDETQLQDLISLAVDHKKISQNDVAKMTMMLKCNSSIVFDAIIELCNQRYALSASYINSEIKPYFLKLRKEGFDSVVSNESLSKVRQTHRKILFPLLEASTVEAVQAFELSDTSKQHKLITNHNLIKDDKMVNLSLTNSPFMIELAVLDLHLNQTDMAKRVKLYKQIEPEKTTPYVACLVVWDLIKHGCVDEVKKLHFDNNRKLFSNALPAYFIPSDLLVDDESVRKALMAHLTSLHGAETAAWIVYLSLLNNGLIAEAEKCAKDLTWSNELKKKVLDVLDTDRHVHGICANVNLLAKQCAHLDGFCADELLLNYRFITNLMCAKMFDQCELLLAERRKAAGGGELKLEQNVKETLYNNFLKARRAPVPESKSAYHESVTRLLDGKVDLELYREMLFHLRVHFPRNAHEFFFKQLTADKALFERAKQLWSLRFKKAAFNPLLANDVMMARLDMLLEAGHVDEACALVGSNEKRRGEEQIYARLGAHARRHKDEKMLSDLLEESGHNRNLVESELVLYKFAAGISDTSIFNNPNIFRKIGRHVAGASDDGLERALAVAVQHKRREPALASLLVGLFEADASEAEMERCLDAMKQPDESVAGKFIRNVQSIAKEQRSDPSRLARLLNRYPPPSDHNLDPQLALTKLRYISDAAPFLPESMRESTGNFADAAVASLPAYAHARLTLRLYNRLRHENRFGRRVNVPQTVTPAAAADGSAESTADPLDNEEVLKMLFDKPTVADK